MADKIEDGGPAFPFNAADHGYEPSSGMSLRDYFAGQALSSIMQDKAVWDCRGDEQRWIADRMYDWADAMLKSRKGEL